MSTETLGGTRPITLRPQRETGHVSLSFTNGSGGDLSEGMLVKLKTDGTVDKLAANTDLPIGIVEKGGATATSVTVGTFFQCTCNGVAVGGTLAVGDTVTQDGALTGTLPKFKIAATTGHIVAGVVLKGGAAAAQVKIGILRSPFKF